jgi:hypothetical protein
MPSRQLYLHIRDLLHVLHNEPENRDWLSVLKRT